MDVRPSEVEAGVESRGRDDVDPVGVMDWEEKSCSFDKCQTFLSDNQI